MSTRPARRALLATALPALLAPALVTTGLGSTVAAHAADEVVDEPGVDVPAINSITTENEAGGLTPYILLSSKVMVTFTDPTPSKATAYRVKVPGVGTFKYAQESYETNGEFTIAVDAYQLPVDTELGYVVKEVKDGEVVSSSEPAPFTFSYVAHPRRMTTSSEKVDGRWTYRAGDRATFRFKGEWEEGTEVTTQVWVSRTKRFTDRDWSYNVYKGGALVGSGDTDQPVMSVKITRDLVGKYVWVSALGWKDGRGGWTYQMKPAQVIRR